jgi:hypothetical protein
MGGVWSGPGVVGSTFYPAVAGPGDHIIKYEIINPDCQDFDNTTITVVPFPVVSIDDVGVPVS